MKKIFLPLAILLVPTILSAQNFQWGNRYSSLSVKAGIQDLAVASNGDIVSAGLYSGAMDVDPSDAVFELAAITTGWDYFLMRNAPNGSFISALTFPGSFNEIIKIATDGDNNTFILANFSTSHDFDPSSGVYELNPTDSRNLFLAKYDGNNALVWAKKCGSSGAVSPEALATDAEGNLYVSVLFSQDLFLDGEELFSGLPNSLRSGIMRISPSGNMDWVGKMSGNVNIRDMAVSPSGKLYTVGGYFYSGDFDISEESEFIVDAHGSYDAFMSVYNTDGSFVDAFHIGKSGYDIAHSLAFYPNNDVVMVGEYTIQIDCVPNSSGLGLHTQGGTDGSFIAKYDADLNLIWQQQIGKAADTFNSDVAIDIQGNVCTVGWFEGVANFEPSLQSSNHEITSQLRDGFFSKLDTDGNYVFGGKFAGPSDYDRAHTITTDASGAVYIGGVYAQTADIDPGETEYLLTSNGGDNGFLMKMDGYTVSAPTVINDDLISVYPNPSNGNFYIENSSDLNISEITVYNELGQIVDVQITGQGNRMAIQINTAPGIYFMEAIMKNGPRSVSKLIVE